MRNKFVPLLSCNRYHAQKQGWAVNEITQNKRTYRQELLGVITVSVYVHRDTGVTVVYFCLAVRILEAVNQTMLSHPT